MKKISKNAVMFFALSLLPTALVMVCGFSIAASLVLIATFFVVAVVIINQSFAEESFSFIRAKKMHVSIGATIALSETVIKIPPTIAIIIVVGLLVIGLFQIIREGSLFGLDFHEKWNDEWIDEQFGIIPNALILLSALFSGLMIVSHFSDQLIWVPLAALGFLTIASIHLNVFDLWNSDKVAIQVVALTLAAITGIISTVIQFNEARIFGLLIWVITLVIGIILILTLVFLYIRAIIREKKRRELEKAESEAKQIKEKQEKERLEKSLLERISELTWREIFTGFNRFNEAFGIKLFLACSNLEKLPELITVSNEKGQIFWNNDLSNMFQVMDSAARKVQDDENLKKILDVCTSIENFVRSKKSKVEVDYRGELELMGRLYSIRKLSGKAI